MNEISRERRLEILSILGSKTCGSCGGRKREKMSHCTKCYYALPSATRRALYQGFGDGYEEAYEESLRILAEPKPTTTPTCRRCPAPIIFAQQNPTAKNPSPANNPLNAEPHPKGNLRLDRASMKYDVLSGDALKAAQAAGEPLFLSHFVDCPYRQQFKKGAGR
jgi:hypothetical protein